ncbi:hypothetical protein F2Q69_00033293 [Brassica cretica]|uniref:Uncharacterized protein n=1 Tax=Brassica cretica TaxID=69181 RepID=A0A8S9SJC0_BRACR|nr:hypothetical protein F2Q69_00033293 [Brassica cretica]
MLRSRERRREGEWNRKPSGPVALTAEEEAVLREGIRLELLQWTAMKADVDNGWDGIDSYYSPFFLDFLIHDQRWWLSGCFIMQCFL